MGCLVQGLEDIHSFGYVQRDIKPMNVIFETDGYVKYLDFGISIKYDMNSENKYTIRESSSGTPIYEAPEVINKRKHGPVSDYYALGVILYKLLKGKKTRPYDGSKRD